MDVTLLVLARGSGQRSKTQAKGELFEQLMAKVLHQLGYDIPNLHRPGSRRTGMQIDIEGTNRKTGAKVIGECKNLAHAVDSPTLMSFFGKYMTLRRKDPALEALLIAPRGLNPEAMTTYRDEYEDGRNGSFRVLEEQQILEAIYSADLAVRPEKIATLIPNYIGTPKKLTLIYTDDSFFWVQYVDILGSGFSRAAAIFDGKGNIIYDADTIKELKKLYSALAEPHLTIITELAADVRPFREITPKLVDEGIAYGRLWDRLERPDWPYFSADPDKAQDIRRSHYDELYRRVTNPPETDKNYFQPLVGKTGSGKTSILMRLAADLCRVETNKVLWLDAEAAIGTTAQLHSKVASAAKSYGSDYKLFIVIDNILLLPNIPLFLHELRHTDTGDAQIIVVGTSQQTLEEYPELKGTGTLGILASFDAESPYVYLNAQFSDDELRELIMLLYRKGQLLRQVQQVVGLAARNKEGYAVINAACRVLNITNDSRVLYEPRQSISLLTKGVIIRELVERDLIRLQAGSDFTDVNKLKPVVRLCVYVCLLYSEGIAAPYEWLSAIERGNSYQSVLSLIRKGKLATEGLIEVDADGYFTAKHQVDAYAVRTIVFGNDDARDRLTEAYSRIIAKAPNAASAGIAALLLNLTDYPYSNNTEERISLARSLVAKNKDHLLSVIKNSRPVEIANWLTVYGRLGLDEDALSLANWSVGHVADTHELSRIYMVRGVIRRRMGQTELGRLDVEKAMNLTPNDAEAVYNYALVNLADGIKGRAIEMFNRSIALQPIFPQAYTGLGIAYNILPADNKAAIEAFNKAIEQDPSYAKAYMNRGITYVSLSRSEPARAEDAVQDFITALEQGLSLGHKFIEELANAVISPLAGYSPEELVANANFLLINDYFAVACFQIAVSMARGGKHYGEVLYWLRLTGRVSNNERAVARETADTPAFERYGGIKEFQDFLALSREPQASLLFLS
ncbi:MAG: hypothetical protein DLM69_06440 [Candidatus Chloroheliales bacterium]|nr:MAG: hypothetical protein DLM69_06440 [Chloroflexota bacterium]